MILLANLHCSQPEILVINSLVGRYDTPLVGCDAVIHAASPLNPKLKGGEYDGIRDM